MADPEILKYLATLGVGGVLAAVMFSIYRKDSLQMQEAWKGQSALLVQVVKEVTVAVTALSTLVQEMSRERRDGPR